MIKAPPPSRRTAPGLRSITGPPTKLKRGSMSKVRVAGVSISLDGFGAGPRQDLNHPLGVSGLELHGWLLDTQMFKSMNGKGWKPKPSITSASQAFEEVGAWILARNMFGPVRGPWNDDSWKGWWGNNPPYHTPVFVLTHHARSPVEMEDGTTFYFIADGLEAALRKAKQAAQGEDVRIRGGVSVIRQYLMADQIDEIHLAIPPVLLSEGEHLWSGISSHAVGFTDIRTFTGEKATHVVIGKKANSP
jgi:dihydrofolate reductase